MTARRPRLYTLQFRPLPGRDPIHSLRGVLKDSLRRHGMRCVSVREQRFHQHSRHRRHRAAPTAEESLMEKSNLEKLKHYAATTRSQMAFGGCPFIKWDYKNGKYLVGKNNTDFTGKKLVADVGNVMGGYQKLEAGEKPAYALTKILDPTVEPIERSELGQTDESRWTDGKDPWVGATVLPFFDPDTRQVFILVATYAGRSETGSVIRAFVENSEANPEAADQLPIVQLCVREYVKGDGATGYAMQLDIVGWTERPKAVLNVEPPPLSIATPEAKTNGGKVAPTADGPQTAAKPKRRIAIPGKPDLDDEIPF